jgi:hypothetical protein
MTSSTHEQILPETSEPLVTEVPETLPRSIVALFWLFARPYATTVVLMMVASVSLRALSVLQFYAAKRIVDTAAHTDLHAPDAWGVLVRPLLQFFAIIAVFIVVEWGGWCSRMPSGTAPPISTTCWPARWHTGRCSFPSRRSRSSSEPTGTICR